MIWTKPNITPKLPTDPVAVLRNKGVVRAVIFFDSTLMCNLTNAPITTTSELFRQKYDTLEAAKLAAEMML